MILFAGALVNCFFSALVLLGPGDEVFAGYCVFSAAVFVGWYFCLLVSLSADVFVCTRFYGLACALL